MIGGTRLGSETLQDFGLLLGRVWQGHRRNGGWVWVAPPAVEPRKGGGVWVGVTAPAPRNLGVHRMRFTAGLMYNAGLRVAAAEKAMRGRRA